LSSSSLVGRKLGKYLIVEQIGKGGMAAVYKGLQPEVDRYVAIKVLPPHPGQDSGYIERFRLEAKTVARLQHPHIVPLYDYGSEGDVLYLVTAFIDSGSLSDKIRKRPLPFNDADRILTQISGALDYAHKQGVIHRDIKPDNVLMDSEGHPLLADFGIVKLTETTSNLTGTGGLIGTPAYMSPEQAQGNPVDERTDIYSLGIVTYEMLTGRQPYKSDTAMQVVLMHINAPVPLLSDAAENVSPELDAVMRRVLAKHPEDRYSTAMEFASAFHEATQGQAPLKTIVVTSEMVQAATNEARLSSSTPPPPTQAPSPTQAASVDAASTTGSPMATTTPTIVVQPGGLNNPLVLLGGFAIIAVTLIAVVLLILNRPTDTATETAQEVTSQALTPVNTPLPTIPPVPSFGGVNFTSVNSPGDSLSLLLQGTAPPPSGQTVVAWLINTRTGDTLLLGTIPVDALGNGALTYTNEDGLFLPTLFNAVAISRETELGDVPAGDIVYSGRLPAEVNTALQAILINTSIPEGNGKPAYEGSLLAGVLSEAGIAQSHAGLAAGATTVGSMHTHNEHTINILHGTAVDYDGNGSGSNPGRGYGVGYFLDQINAALNAAATASDADRAIQSQVDLIGNCIGNALVWSAQIVDLELQFLASDSVEAVQAGLAESTRLADMLLNGTDLNGNGIIDPFEGECGLSQIEQYGISVANVPLREGAIDLPDLQAAVALVREIAPTLPPQSSYDPDSEN
jgi:serine/threonine-protein kinase